MIIVIDVGVLCSGVLLKLLNVFICEFFVW